MEVLEITTGYHYVLELRERLDTTMKMAQEELGRSQVRNKRLSNPKTKKRVFHVGDKLLFLLKITNCRYHELVHILSRGASGEIITRLKFTVKREIITLIC